MATYHLQGLVDASTIQETTPTSQCFRILADFGKPSLATYTRVTTEDIMLVANFANSQPCDGRQAGELHDAEMCLAGH